MKYSAPIRKSNKNVTFLALKPFYRLPGSCYGIFSYPIDIKKAK